MFRTLTVFSLATVIAVVAMTSTFAADEPPPPPPLPPPEQRPEEQPLEPEVTIIQRKGHVIEEYRVNGRLRYVKIIPENAPPYYLIDMDGDGNLETRRREFDNPPLNQWMLLQW